MKKYFYSFILSLLYLCAHAQWPSNYNNAIAVSGYQLNDVSYGTLSDGDGGVFVLWKKSLNKNDWTNDIVLSYYDKGGMLQWKKVIFTTANLPKSQNSTDISEENIQLIADGSGGAIVTWQDGRNYPNVYISYGDVYGQRITKAGQTLWTPNGKLLISAGDGLLNINTTILKGSNSDFYIIRSQEGYCMAMSGGCSTIDKIGAYLFDINGNSLWTGEKEIYKTNNVQQQFLFAATYDATANAIFVTWQDARANTCGPAPYYNYGCIQNFDLYAQKLDASTGAKLWADTGVEVNATPDNSSMGGDKTLNPQILSDHGNGVVVAWYDYRDNAGAYLYGMRIAKSDGQKLWTAPGKKLSSAILNVEYGTQYKLMALADNIPIVSFASVAKTIYAQKFNLNATLLWGPQGKSISDNSGNNINPTIIPNGNEPIVMWEKVLGYASETLYAQKLNQDGSLNWNSARRINSGFGGWGARAISDDNGGITVAWTDYQLGNNNMEVKLSGLSSTGKFKGGLTLALGSGSGSKNQEVDVPLSVYDFTNILTTQFTIEWDPTKISFIDVSDFGLPSINKGSFGITDVANGKLTFSWDDPESNGQSLNDNAALFFLKFKLIGEPGTTADLSITDGVIPVEVYDNDFDKSLVNKFNGSIYIEAYGFNFTTYYLKGNAKGADAGPVSDVDLYLNSDIIATSDSEGQALISLLPDESNSIQTIRPVRVDYDKTGVDAADLILMRKHLLGSEPLTSPYQLFAADVDNTGTITTVDIAFTRAYILGKQDDFKGKTWTFVNDYKFFTDATKYNVQATPFSYLNNMPVDFTNQSLDDLLTPGALKFVAIKLGDIDASWANTDPAGGRVNQQELSIHATYPMANTGGVVEIPLTISDFNDISAFQFSLTWNKNELKYIGVDAASLPLAFNENKVNDGVMSVVWDHSQGQSSSLENGTQILKLKFEKIEGDGTLQLGSSLTKAVAFNNSIKPVAINFSGEKDSGSTFANGTQTYPVPFKEELNTNFSLQEERNVKITLYTSTGKEVYSYEKAFEKGDHKVTINSSALPAGLYLHKIIIGNETKVVKVIK